MLFTSERLSSRRQVAAALADALEAQGIRFRRVRDRQAGWTFIIDGLEFAPWQAAQVYLPGGWSAFYDGLDLAERGGGR